LLLLSVEWPVAVGEGSILVKPVLAQAVFAVAQVGTSENP
jgi:hypothetical protein